MLMTLKISMLSQEAKSEIRARSGHGRGDACLHPQQGFGADERFP